MHLLGEMGDEAACRHGYHIFFIDLVPGRHPPRAFHHRDEAVVGMEVWLAEISRLESIENHVRFVLGRIAMQHDLIRARHAGGVAPFRLDGQRRSALRQIRTVKFSN
jgi:hypothetical protein